MHPWPLAPEVTGRPCDLDVLGRDLVDQFDVDQMAIESYSIDAWPHELRPARNATTDQIAATMKFAHVKAIDC
jgi:hypothetical protein